MVKEERMDLQGLQDHLDQVAHQDLEEKQVNEVKQGYLDLQDSQVPLDLGANLDLQDQEGKVVYPGVLVARVRLEIGESQVFLDLLEVEEKQDLLAREENKDLLDSVDLLDLVDLLVQEVLQASVESQEQEVNQGHQEMQVCKNIQTE